MALFALGGLTVLVAFYLFQIQTRHRSNAREIAVQLFMCAQLIHDSCDRQTLNSNDRDRLKEIMPSVDGMVKALTEGGTSGELTLPPPTAEEKEAADRVAAVWARTRPGIERLIRGELPERQSRPVHTLLHPEVAEFEGSSAELTRWWRANNLRHRQRMLYVLIAASVLNGVLLVLGVQRIRRRVLAPVRSLEEGAARIRGGDLRHRVPVAGDDELGALARSFNDMASEIDRLVTETQEAGARIAATNRELEQEVRQRRKAEEDLRKSESRLERAQNISHTGNWEVTLATGEMYWSAEVYRIFGLEREPNLHRHSRFWESVHPDDVDAVRDASRAALEGLQSYRIDHRIVRPDGSVRVVREQAELAFENGVAVSMEGTVQDITEFRRLEEQYRHAQKMEAVGRLAGGVAHDFNNLLTVILGFTRMSLDAIANGKPVERYLETVLASGERASTLTAQLLAFSRRQVLQPRVINVNELLRDLQPMLRQLVTEAVHISFDARAEAAQIKVDPGQFEQVILNLVSNSRDAMPHGGRLLIETSNASVDAETATRKEGLVPGPHVLIAVSDNGTGMDAATLSRVFEPFFTTKDAGKGTGLGMATVYGIVKQSGGDVAIYSEPGRGTTVKVYLPVTSDAAQQPAPGGGADEPAGGSETLLVVEDEAAVRALACEVLRDAGYQVLDAGNVSDALRVAGAHMGQIDLLVTDVIMPGGSGPELARRLATERYGLKILYMSGYTEGAVSHHTDLEGGASFLSKPFTPALLLDGVRSALDRN